VHGSSNSKTFIVMKNTVLISIKLTQFENYQTCNWVKSLISLSSDFFNKKKVLNATLFLESTTHNVDKALNYLNEASGMDFSYTRYKTGNISLVESLLCEK